MQDIKQREEKIKETRKNTHRKEFIKEIASRFSVVLYKNNGLISKYPHNNRIKGVLKSIDYENKREDYTKFGFEYDPNESFFENLKTLMQNVELPNLVTYGGIENSEYADITHNTKNAYLVFNSVWDNENLLYSSCVKDKCVNVLNSVMVRDGSQNIYFCSAVVRGFKIFFSKFIVNSDNIRFSSNLMGCSECIFCNDLTNKKYCINNLEYEKELYFSKKEFILKQKNEFLHNYKNIHIEGKNFGSNNANGNFIVNSENISNGNLVYQVKNGNNLVITGSAKGNERMYDVFVGGSNVSSDFYGASGSGTAQNIYIGDSVRMSSNIYYSLNIQDCSYCLGCIGLKNKSFCILNKQYTKEEWFELANKIFQQMDSEGTLGDFFPGSMNPFYFNDTIAYLIDDTFTKEEVTKDGYLWRDEQIKVDIPEGSEVVESLKVQSQKSGNKCIDDFQGFDANGNWTINPEILKKVIKDEKGNYYKIVKMEYDFLLKYGLPLPEIHWLDRIKLGFKFK